MIHIFFVISQILPVSADSWCVQYFQTAMSRVKATLLFGFHVRVFDLESYNIFVILFYITNDLLLTAGIHQCCNSKQQSGDSNVAFEAKSKSKPNVASKCVPRTHTCIQILPHKPDQRNAAECLEFQLGYHTHTHTHTGNCPV